MMMVFTPNISKQCIKFYHIIPTMHNFVYGWNGSQNLWIAFCSQMRLNFTVMVSPIQKVCTLRHTAVHVR